MEKRYFYKDDKGNKYSFKSEHKDLTPITEEEFNAKPQISDEEKAKIENQRKINELKQQLADTDYKVLKYVEGKISSLEFSQIMSERQKWREEIDKLEKEL